MTQPPAEGRDQGDEPGRDPRDPGGPARDPRLAGFMSGGAWDACPPSAVLAAAAEGVSGPGRECPGATGDELDGVLGRWAALESWAQAGKLGVIREKIRRAEPPGPRGTVSSTTIASIDHDVALILSVSVPSAGKATWLAAQLTDRLPGIGALLADGTLTQSKAAMLAQEFAVLDNAQAVQAEALILGQLAGRTHGQLARLAAQAACSVDPEGAQERREASARDDARVRLWREQSGTAAMQGSGLPSDEALSAYANVCARAQDYKDSSAFGNARMDQLRAMAYLDLINGVTLPDRVARARARAEADARAARDPDAGTDPGASADADPAPSTKGTSEPDASDDEPATDDPDGGDTGDDGPDPDDLGPDDLGPDDLGPDDLGPDDLGPDDLGPGGSGPGGQPGGSPPSSGPDPDPRPKPGTQRRPALQDLIIPLRTLLGLAARPGEGHNLGPLDPGLALDLATAAALSRYSEWCVTIVDQDGIAIGHGCARPGRHPSPAPSAATPSPATAAFPARVNLTIPLSALPELSGQRDGPARSPNPWTFTPRDDPGPPGGYGTWTLTLPGGREFAVRLAPVPVFDCDHRNESRAYQPNATLRHLVQIRDGHCTFPPCSRHARETDFEHAVPYDQGGRTCACNAGARSRACHRVKQSPGWNVTQPKPGWHQWTTPSGRTYTQGPKQYPA